MSVTQITGVWQVRLYPNYFAGILVQPIPNGASNRPATARRLPACAVCPGRTSATPKQGARSSCPGQEDSRRARYSISSRPYKRLCDIVARQYRPYRRFCDIVARQDGRVPEIGCAVDISSTAPVLRKTYRRRRTRVEIQQSVGLKPQPNPQAVRALAGRKQKYTPIRLP